MGKFQVAQVKLRYKRVGFFRRRWAVILSGFESQDHAESFMGAVAKGLNDQPLGQFTRVEEN